MLLAGFDENFISERFLRRSYGIVWERAVRQLKDPKTPHRAEVCPFDNTLVAPDMSKFLLKSVSELAVTALSSLITQFYSGPESQATIFLGTFRRLRDQREREGLESYTTELEA